MSDTAVSVDANWAVIASFAVYLLLLVGIALYAAGSRSGSMTDFFLGGRAMKHFVVAMSAVTSGRSGWLVLGVTGLAFVDGAAAVWSVVGYTTVELFLFLFAAPRLRRFTGRMKDITLPDFFASRLGGGPGLRVLIVTVVVLFMTAYVSSQFAAGGKAFAGTFGVADTTGVWITAGVVLVYTLLGGYVAVALSDAVQAIFMIVGLVVLPLVVVASLGWGPMFDTLRALDPALLDPYAIGFGGIIAAVGIGLGSPGQPHIVVRYMSIDDPASLRPAALWGTVWNVLMGWGAVFIGLSGRAVYGDVEALPGADSEQLFPFLANAYLPGIIAGLLIAAVFAAIMSSADSQLLVATSGVVRDIYQRLIKKDAEDLNPRHLVMVSRVVVLVICLLAVGLLYVPGVESLVFWLVLFAWAGLGAAFGPPLLLALFWRGTTAAGAAAGIIAGALVTIAWYYTLSDVLYELVPGAIASTVAVVAVSAMTRRPEGVDRMMGLLKGGSGEREDVHG
ncbi:sodium/proline symporter [Nocardiopsis sp. RSe5-2]|uniref:Sodium/proline symporter n=1 Tax=Nocardiopsis endophytica TaxID=3018445 RepID=A0ABT4TZG5_9ACTN|nr:sodium/proline symporter [Nocardiopsis endophytica]MDA2810088.1 sodium/proline symporter [Nocardiopsis endophytica]